MSESDANSPEIQPGSPETQPVRNNEDFRKKYKAHDRTLTGRITTITGMRPNKPTPCETPPAEKPQYTKEEQELIDFMEKRWGRKLTPQEINLSLEQARSVGHLQVTGDPQYSPEEREIIDWLEKGKGRKLTPQEINLSLEQARAIGEL